MNNVSVMNYNYRRYPFEYFLDSMVRLGVDAIELWAAEPHMYVDDLPESRLRAIRSEIKRRDLKVVCFTPEQCVYPVNIAAKEKRLRERSIAYFKKSLDVAVELESPLLLVVPGSGFYNEPKEEGFKRSAESLSLLGEEAEKAGVCIVMETRSPMGTNLVNNLGDLQRLVDAVDSPFVQPMLDTVPMFTAGENVEMYLQEFGEHLRHVHFCDGDGKGGSNMAVGDGVFPMEQYWDTLNREYTGYMTLELVVNRYYLEPEREVHKCLERLRAFTPKAGQSGN
ncbi:TIM barrel protein [Paenibacillus albidus]|uniref:TIM barrel protein n=1 Tax=Paenibacillus albidus TaxID=2041023 RepID=UPI001BEBD02D|nr:TIM barrel protein [Paenibacillus albidus]MBT2293653.1 TIM barrel protein [Paenibacillus albidus]